MRRQVWRQPSRIDLAGRRTQHRDLPGTKLKRAALIAILLEQAERAVVAPGGDGRTSLRRIAQARDLAPNDLEAVDLLYRAWRPAAAG
ncbi:hypothetical protein [Bradyrhizobium diazoefficiens]|uniref:hypothetical protein n=1 Tax=Bradyrhizobium diazoefficiens TaxID=1355477 RepID=UPI001B4CD2B5|nr:hypothetical protein [Bradyrhizobium japonicum]